jgi:peptide-methionine (S)-S-oxide reductase
MKLPAMRNLLLIPVAVLTLSAASTFPNPPNVPAPAKTSDTVVLAGGCFWGMQLVFDHVKGVTKTVVGYAGGDKKTADYETVSTGTTGHAESIQITFDPAQISFGTLLKVYFSVAHNPTELNYQDNDHGTQYRSSIFFTSEDQKQMADAYVQELDGAKVYKQKIVTKIVPLQAFYPAEEYHQKFAVKNPTQGYIVAMDIPKYNNLKKQFPELLKGK